MPVVKRFPSCKVCMYAADHLPPHFHILANDGKRALVEISTLSVLAGRVGGSVLAEVILWASAEKESLKSKWDELNHG